MSHSSNSRIFHSMQPDNQTYIQPHIHTTFECQKWLHHSQKHKNLLSDILDPYLDKRSRQIKDPVLDFLFEYYHFRPAQLMRWSPGIGIALDTSDAASALPEISELTIDRNCAYLDPTSFPDNRKESAVWILELLEKSSSKKPSFGCFGMHEWAMVYKADKVRHNQLPLRMGQDELAEFVESRPIVCTHFDAFRFFTREARPMNKHDLTRQNFLQNEQAGCIHTNMDLYKWAFKMYPWISSERVREAFLLAVDARYIDMQASPYDLRSHGLEPICIETVQGRQIYLSKQKEIYEKSCPIRQKLIEEYRELICNF